MGTSQVAKMVEKDGCFWRKESKESAKCGKSQKGFYDYRDNKGHQCSLLGTTLGAFCVFFLKNELSKGMQKALTGFAAGVMVAASIWSLLLPALEQGASLGMWKFLPAVIGFWIGILFLMAIDYFAPPECIDEKCKNKLLLAVTLHNIPEGIATFMASSMDKTLGISLAIAIAMHNLPEGISIAVPIYYSTNKKSKAFIYTFISAISEPFGALIAFIFLKNFVNDIFMGLLFSFIAGIMIHISFYELLPESKRYKNYKLTSIFFIIGIIFMCINLFLF